MNAMLREALRKYSGLRQQVDNVLLGDDGDMWEGELKKFLAKRECWVKGKTPSSKITFADWQAFYRKYFDIDLGTVTIPAPCGEFTRTVVVVKGLTLNRVYEVCTKHFPCWRYNKDLDKVIIHNDRDTKNSSYAVLVRDVVEADEIHKNKSTNTLAQAKVQGSTLLERMLLELKYFDETGKHLDIENGTLCSGSRGADGSVPHAGWLDEFGVFWCHSSSAGGNLRVREVVS